MLKIKKVASMSLMTAILAMVLVFAFFSISVSAADESTASTGISFSKSVEIKGSVGNQLTATITLEANKDGFAEILSNTNVNNWFGNLPQGLNAKIASKVNNKTKTLIITISGTPNTSHLQEPILIIIPQKFLYEGSNDIDVYVDSDTIWNIAPTVEFTFGKTEPYDVTKKGTITAKVGTKTYTTNDTIYATENSTITFTATLPTSKNIIYRVKEWTVDGETETNDNGDVITSLTYTYTVDQFAGKMIEVEFIESATAYKVFPLENDPIKSLYTEKDKTVSMDFGAKITFAPIITTNAKSDPTYNPTSKETENSAWYALADDSDYEIEATSSNENIVEITDNEDGTFELTAYGDGTVKITLTVKHDEDSASYKLADAKAEFTVKVVTTTTVEKVSDSDYEIKATTALLETGTSVLTIDFEKETAECTSKIGGYSLNGTAWYEIEITDEPTDISNILDKGGSNVKFTEELEGSKPKKGSAIWKIGKINSRPSAPSLTVVYGKKPDNPGDDDSKWYLKGISSTTKVFYVSSQDGKTPDIDEAGNESWETYENGNVGGVISPWDEDTGKVVKDIYLAKLPPKIETNTENGNADVVKSLTPCSKTKKITVSGMLKPPVGKVDYKKELVSPKTGMYYAIGENSTAFTLMKAANAKKGIKFANIFTGDTANTEKVIVQIYTGSTGSKPRSAITEVIVNNYKEFEGDPTSGFNDIKYKYKLPKGFEVYDTMKKKWVTSVKISKTTTFRIRERGNAKYDNKDGDNNLKAGTAPASKEGSLKIIWGDYLAKEATDKKPEVKAKGVIGVVFTPPKNSTNDNINNGDAGTGD